MYTPKHFEQTDQRALWDFIEEHAFGTLLTVADGQPTLSHVPFLPDREAGVLHCHVARANSHWREIERSPKVLAIFTGPHGYVSPTWYAAAPAVPTWNYGVVHAHGVPRVNEDDGFLRGVIEELASRYEGDRPDGWRAETLPPEFYTGLRRGIVAFELPAARLEGKFKLGQNRSVEDRRRTIAALEREGSREAAALAEFMRRRAGA